MTRHRFDRKDEQTLSRLFVKQRDLNSRIQSLPANHPDRVFLRAEYDKLVAEIKRVARV